MLEFNREIYSLQRQDYDSLCAPSIKVERGAFVIKIEQHPELKTKTNRYEKRRF